MKSLVFFLLLFLSCISKAQEFIPILQEGNVWGVDYYANGSVFSTAFSIDEEVVLNGVAYQSIDGCKFREESGRLIYLNENNGEETIVLDFNLEIGDVVPLMDSGPDCFNNFGGNFNPVTILDVSTAFIAGQTRKVIETDNDIPSGIPELWIEGIGSTNGVIPYYGGADAYNLLICFTKDGETTFFNDATMCDNTFLSVEDNQKKLAKFIPNPVSEISTLQISLGTSIDAIVMYDLNGRLIINDKIKNNQFKLRNTDFKSGMYIYQLLAQGKVIHSDRIVIK